MNPLQLIMLLIREAASTVGRGKVVSLDSEPSFTEWKDSEVSSTLW